jgi:hypothetical protein
VFLNIVTRWKCQALQEYWYATLLADDEWVAKLACPLHISVHFNELNRKMQDKNGNILNSRNKIKDSTAG